MKITKLKEKNIWCLWRYELVNGRRTKVPCRKVPQEFSWNEEHDCWNQGGTGYAARSNDSSTWMSYAYAEDLLKDTVKMNHPVFDGIGIMFTDIDGKALCGIDIDAHGNGEKNPLEEEILSRFSRTYCETSPSGKGKHCLFFVEPTKLPPKGTYLMKKDQGEGFDIEFYAAGHTNKYFTFSGNSLSSVDELCDMTEETAAFIADYMAKSESHIAAKVKEHPKIHHSFGRKMCSSDIEQRLDVARRAANGGKFTALFDEGDYQGEPYYGDHSNADMGLCVILAQYLDADPEKVDIAFRSSKMMREKWNEIHGSDGRTYGAITIGNAVAAAKQSGFIYKEPLHLTDLTDSGNAERFAKMYSSRLRWSPMYGWIVCRTIFRKSRAWAQ